MRRIVAITIIFIAIVGGFYYGLAGRSEVHDIGGGFRTDPATKSAYFMSCNASSVEFIGEGGILNFLQEENAEDLPETRVVVISDQSPEITCTNGVMVVKTSSRDDIVYVTKHEEGMFYRQHG